MCSLSIIVPVYEQWHFIPNLLSAIEAQYSEQYKIEVILIDNGTAERPFIPHKYYVTVLECKKPGSYAARNVGLNYASGELILFTDADCLPEADWIEKMLNAYEHSDKKTLLAGNVSIQSDNIKPTSSELYDIAVGLPQERYVSKGYAVTANLAIPRTVFDEIGLFDGSRFSGGDADFCQRALKAGYKLQFIAGAVVYHPARKTWQEYSTKVRRMKGGQIRAGALSRRFKYLLITFIPPVWRLWRIAQSDRLTLIQKSRVMVFQTHLWGVELLETCALLAGKKPERR